MANVFIDIAAEFTGAKSFKKAESATDSLTKNVKKLAKTIGVAYSGAQVLAFAKSSVKAAAADQKAQQQLALALKNVGLERDAASAEGYIQRLQSEFGIVDDLLRPAYQSLAIATRDTAESQRLLNLSLDISAATGKDLGFVTAALSKAYLGNNTALTRLGVGISKADLKTKSFYEITTNLADTFKGSATAAAATFQGSMDKLAVASANVQEIIGTGIIDALKGLSEDNSVQDLADTMQDAALYTADVIRGIGVLTEKLKGLPGVGSFNVGMIPILGSYLQILRGLGKSAPATGFPQGPPADLTRQFPKAQTKPDKIAKDTLKINKESLKLAKAKAVFDMQKIQIEAALKGKISKEDEIRLKLMKAILDENMTDVEKYQKALETAQTKTKELTELLTAVKDLELKDPFGTWSVDPLTASINELTKSMFSVSTQIQANGKEWSSFANTVATTVIRPNLSEWSSSFGAAGAAASAATTAALKAQQDALTAQTTAASAALQAQSAAQLEALKARLAEEAAAYKELMEATAAAAEAALITGENDYTTANLAKIASEAAAQAAAAAAALAAAEQAAGSAAVTGGSNVNITVNTGIGDPNAIAEEIQKIIEEATQRGTVDFLGIA
jgi:hypothetical protein